MNNKLKEKLSVIDAEELKRCNSDPVYFYNRYVKPEGMKDITQKEFNDLQDERRHSDLYIKSRKGKTVYLHPVLKEDAFKPKQLKFNG